MAQQVRAHHQAMMTDQWKLHTLAPHAGNQSINQNLFSEQ